MIWSPVARSDLIGQEGSERLGGLRADLDDSVVQIVHTVNHLLSTVLTTQRPEVALKQHLYTYLTF